MRSKNLVLVLCLVSGLSLSGCAEAYSNNAERVALTESTTGEETVSNAYRFWSDVFRGHFFTIDEGEYERVRYDDSNWNYEGVAYGAYETQVEDSVPVYRFWSDVFSGHFYTIDMEEYEQVKDYDENWNYEGVAYYVYALDYDGPVETEVVYRFWSPVFLHHFYTAGYEEMVQVRDFDSNWVYEGEAYRVPITNSIGSEVDLTVVDTNQEECYDVSRVIDCPDEGERFYGQDAQYDGAQFSYTDNNDGTVTDNITDLMWAQDAGEKMSYGEAVAGADDYGLAGYNDWRVPTIKELYSLIDFSGADIDPMSTDSGDLDPFINDEVFDFEYGDTSAGDRIIDSQWVTSNMYTGEVMSGQQCFFGVNFADGRIKCYPTADNGHNNGYYVRYVRGGDGYGENDFIDNGDGTVTDQAVGLMWAQNDSGEGMDWESALSYCENLQLAGYNNWRLPNAKELQYIVDYSRGPDETNSAAIDPVFNTSGITNEAGQADYPFFWTGTTHEGMMGGQNAAYIAFGRALGFMNGEWMDVHGAGAQRSDPKSGDADYYPQSRGPQGDVVRVYNYLRCVR